MATPSTPQHPLAELSGQASVLIAAPVEQVFAYMADFSRHAEWNRNIYKIWQTSKGPAGVGTRYKSMEGAPPAPISQQLKAMGQVMAGMFDGAKPLSEAEITLLEPPHRIGWVGIFPHAAGEFNRAEWDVRLMSEGEATRVVQRFRYLPKTAAARKMLAALGDATGIAQACSINLGQLRKRLEQHVRQLA